MHKLNLFEFKIYRLEEEEERRERQQHHQIILSQVVESQIEREIRIRMIGYIL